VTDDNIQISGDSKQVSGDNRCQVLSGSTTDIHCCITQYIKTVPI